MSVHQMIGEFVFHVTNDCIVHLMEFPVSVDVCTLYIVQCQDLRRQEILGCGYQGSDGGDKKENVYERPSLSVI